MRKHRSESGSSHKNAHSDVNSKNWNKVLVVFVVLMSCGALILFPGWFALAAVCAVALAVLCLLCICCTFLFPGKYGGGPGY